MNLRKTLQAELADEQLSIKEHETLRDCLAPMESKLVQARLVEKLLPAGWSYSVGMSQHECHSPTGKNHYIAHIPLGSNKAVEYSTAKMEDTNGPHNAGARQRAAALQALLEPNTLKKLNGQFAEISKLFNRLNEILKFEDEPFLSYYSNPAYHTILKELGISSRALDAVKDNADR